MPDEFLAVAFDSGGVTTGPITVPFIMALGIGVAATRSDGQKAEDDSFGMVALCSIGPILAVLILGICLQCTEISYTALHHPRHLTPPGRLAPQFLHGFPAYMQEVAVGLLPVVVFFALFQIFSLRLQKDALIQPAGGHCLYLCGTGAVPHRRERGLYARRAPTWAAPSPSCPTTGF